MERDTREEGGGIFSFFGAAETNKETSAPSRDVSRNPRAASRTKNPRSRYITPSPPPPPPSSSPPPYRHYRSIGAIRAGDIIIARRDSAIIRYRRKITSTVVVVVVVVSDDETPRSVVVVTRCIIQRARKVGKCIGAGRWEWT